MVELVSCGSVGRRPQAQARALQLDALIERQK
jgi:hypothetical protein